MMLTKKKFAIIINYFLIILIIILLNVQFDLLNSIHRMLTLNLFVIVGYFLFFFILQIFKGVRSTLLIERNVPYIDNLRLLSLGNMYNTLLPARAGDMYRAIGLSSVLSDSAKTPKTIGEGIALIALEKLMDMISLLIIGVVLFLSNTKILQLTREIFFTFALTLILITGFSIFLLSAKSGTIITKIVQLSVKKTLPERYSNHLLDVLASGRNTMYKELGTFKKMIILQLFSFLMVAGDLFLIYIVIVQYASVLPALAILAGVVGFLAVVFPSLPAGMGPFQFGIAVVLFFGTNNLEVGVLSSTTDLFMRSTGYIVLGLIFLILHTRRSQ